MCDSCEVLNINGMNCHELGCPETWKDTVERCKWCGVDFKPKRLAQRFCSGDCARESYS